MSRPRFSGTTRNFYRFRSADGSADYFDGEGRSARQFLLRTPVPNGQFRSGFGVRRHPILGYVKMHTGVDWAAPSGTPILAAGNGVVEKAGWAGGYGRQTIIRHPNGYETSYNHQSAFAKWVKPGAKVRQGQVIGYVGASGLATGAHLHYELIVNGTKVDPMRVRLPNGKILKGDDLLAFKKERDRIDQLLKDEGNSLAESGQRQADQLTACTRSIERPQIGDATAATPSVVRTACRRSPFFHQPSRGGVGRLDRDGIEPVVGRLDADQRLGPRRKNEHRADDPAPVAAQPPCGKPQYAGDQRQRGLHHGAPA